MASGEMCNREMVQHFANEFKDVDASIDDFDCHAAYAQYVV